MPQDLALLSTNELLSKRTNLENEIATYDTAQASTKIEINAGYGALMNKGFRWKDDRLGESITKTGQLASKWCEGRLNTWLNEYLGTQNVEYVVYIDTDSCHITLQNYVDQKCRGMDVEDIIKALDKFAKDEILPFTEVALEELGTVFNHRGRILQYSRECIAELGIFTGKKHYIYKVLDLEGRRQAPFKLKMMGIEAVKSSTPRAAREKIKAGIHVIVTEGEKEFQSFVDDTREEFLAMTFDDIAFPRTCNNLVKYSDHYSVFKKGCPMHVRAALTYNDLVKKNNLQDRLRLIEDGEKIKFSHLLMPNPTQSNVIASPGDLPEELGLHKYIDYHTQFQKGFLDPLETIAKAIGWNTEEQASMEQWFVYN